MSYSRSRQSTQRDKKLQHLRMQLYGNEVSIKTTLPKEEPQTSYNFSPATGSTLNLNESSLRHDLLKSFSLAALAIAIQVLLYLLIQRGFVKF